MFPALCSEVALPGASAFWQELLIAVVLECWGYMSATFRSSVLLFQHVLTLLIEISIQAQKGENVCHDTKKKMECCSLKILDGRILIHMKKFGSLQNDTST